MNPRSDDDNRESGHREKSEREQPSKPPVYKRPAVIIGGAILLFAIVAAGLLWWLHARQYVSTDDAYIDGHVTQVSPQIAALVVKLHITDNQFVQQGDLVIELY